MTEAGFNVLNKRPSIILPYVVRLINPSLLKSLHQEEEQRQISLDAIKGILSVWCFGLVNSLVVFLVKEKRLGHLIFPFCLNCVQTSTIFLRNILLGTLKLVNKFIRKTKEYLEIS